MDLMSLYVTPCSALLFFARGQYKDTQGKFLKVGADHFGGVLWVKRLQEAGFDCRPVFFKKFPKICFCPLRVA